ncbi:7332_t:CDS:2 [Ambispora gerdemannii]|uniref:7332_t:CDS:1 n=1 Tax=Ambispora gerdemannii TaxID=144530 RepID=A0A9N8YW21_9GLOM|nr:7332_t:CDS:2 [Ambispora gerdemannii]
MYAIWNNRFSAVANELDPGHLKEVQLNCTEYIQLSREPLVVVSEYAENDSQTYWEEVIEECNLENKKAPTTATNGGEATTNDEAALTANVRYDLRHRSIVVRFVRECTAATATVAVAEVQCIERVRQL